MIGRKVHHNGQGGGKIRPCVKLMPGAPDRIAVLARERAQLVVGDATILRDSDLHVDRLFARAPEHGATLLTSEPVVLHRVPDITDVRKLLAFFRELGSSVDMSLSPIFNVPASGCSLPVIIRNSVVFPAPFGPMTPTIPPRGSVKLRLSMSMLSP